MSRFSPEFAAKLRKKIGDPEAFREARRRYHQWRSSFSVEVISPFCNRCVNALRRDLGGEVPEGLEELSWATLPPVIDETAPPLTPSQEHYLTELAERSPFLIRAERIRGRLDGMRPYSEEELTRSAYARAETRLYQLERQYLEISHTVAVNAMRDPLHHPTASEREIVNYLREKLEQAHEEIRRSQRRHREQRQRDVADSQRLAYEMMGRTLRRE